LRISEQLLGRRSRQRSPVTLEQLAQLPFLILFRPSRGTTEGYARIREQARIQLEARNERHLKYELLDFEPDDRLFRLPAPSAERHLSVCV